MIWCRTTYHVLLRRLPAYFCLYSSLHWLVHRYQTFDCCKFWHRGRSNVVEFTTIAIPDCRITYDTKYCCSRLRSQAYHAVVWYWQTNDVGLQLIAVYGVLCVWYHTLNHITKNYFVLYTYEVLVFTYSYDLKYRERTASGSALSEAQSSGQPFDYFRLRIYAYDIHSSSVQCKRAAAQKEQQRGEAFD